MSNLIGKTLLNRYTVREFLGRGGMAEVYKVWDNQRNSYLAMKALHDKLAQNQEFLAYFRQEADTLAELTHPNIVRFYGFKKDRGHSFILMDFIEGEALNARLKKRAGQPLKIGEIKMLLAPVLGALQFAHNRGMVHCDIKPANIILNEKNTVFLADFGIARAINLDKRSLTSSGTPAYMAPELVQNQPPTPETDIYALGVVLFEMLTGGERPFRGKQAQTTGSLGNRIRWEQVHSQPPSLYQWNPSLDPNLNAIVLKCLEKDPQKRYHSALDLLNALKLVGAAEQDENKTESTVTISASPKATPPKKEKKPTQRKSQPIALWGLLGIVVLAAVALIAFLLTSGGKFASPTGGSSSASAPTQQAVSPAQPAETNTPFIQFLVRPYDKTRDADAQIFDVKNRTFLSSPGRVTWYADFPSNAKALLMIGWCAKDQATLRENLSYMNDQAVIDGQEISISKFATLESQDNSGKWCHSYLAVLSGWQSGTHSYIRTQHIRQTINDGESTFTAGDYITEYVISVK